MVQVLTVSAYTAGWAMEALKPPIHAPASVVAREKRLREIRQERDGISDAGDIEGPLATVQSTSVALDLLTEDNRQPRPTVQHVIDSYIENE